MREAAGKTPISADSDLVRQSPLYFENVSEKSSLSISSCSLLMPLIVRKSLYYLEDGIERGPLLLLCTVKLKDKNPSYS